MVRLKTALLWQLDKYFPPDPSAYMSPEEQTTHEARKALGSMGRYLAELPSTDIDALDFGCGWGGETIWLAERIRSVAGVDVDAPTVAQAQAVLASSSISNCRFVHSADGRLPFADRSFDAVFSSDTFEHVQDLDLAFNEIFRVLRPGGALITRFGPLFYSPHGYHLYWACKVPYAHLLFGLDPILALRQARSGQAPREASWVEMGLNGRVFEEFDASARRAGFEMLRFERIAVKQLRRLAQAPVLSRFFVFGIDCHIRRP